MNRTKSKSDHEAHVVAIIRAGLSEVPQDSVAVSFKGGPPKEGMKPQQWSPGSFIPSNASDASVSNSELHIDGASNPER